VLPAATWYEKFDLDDRPAPVRQLLQPGGSPALGGQVRLGRVSPDREGVLTPLAERHLGVRRDLVAAPLLHDSPDEIAQPMGEVRDWKAGECEPVPGRTMPKLLVIERDYRRARRSAGRRSGRC